MILASIFVVFLAICLAFATIGAWLVLPFAGLELVAVYWAFRCMERRAADFESIVISGDRLVIERREQGRTSRFECNRYWAQVRWNPARRGRRGFLVIQSHGREVEFGRHLPEDKLRALVAHVRYQIRQQISNQ